MTFRYAPGTPEWVGLVADHRALLIGGGPSSDLIEALWARLGGGAPLLLEQLTAAGLQATPPFALVEPADEGLRVIVRGSATVTVEGDSVTGGAAATWIERILPMGPVEIHTVASDRSARTLPLVRGVVATARLVSSGAAVQDGGLDVPAALASSAAPASFAAAPASTDSAPRAGAPSAAEPVPVVADSPAAGQSAAPSESTIVHENLDLQPAASEHTLARATSDSATESTDYDYLFGATVYRSVHDAVVEPESVDSDLPGSPSDDFGATANATIAGDHDGETMFVSKHDRIRARGARGAAVSEPSASEPPPPAPQPVVVLSTGATHHLDTPLVLGRAPSVSGVPAAELPRLVPLTGGDHDLSRNHVRVEVQGGTVVVTDLNSKNGTTVALPGSGPVRLRGGEPTPVIAGTAIELGGVVTIMIEETS
jgi:hypothetical protein